MPVTCGRQRSATGRVPSGLTTVVLHECCRRCQRCVLGKVPQKVVPQKVVMQKSVMQKGCLVLRASHRYSLVTTKSGRLSPNVEALRPADSGL